MASKINQILNKWPRGTVALQSWLTDQGVNRQLAHEYCNGQWLRRLGHGAYAQYSDKVDWKGAVFALQNHADLHVWPGGQTALALQGYAHYLPLSKETVYLFGTAGTRLPSWMKHHDWGVTLRFRATRLFTANNKNMANEIDLAAAKFGNFSIRISSLERATFELLYMVNDKPSFTHAAELMEGLATLRPAVVSTYLKACKSVKVTRLLLFFAEYFQHAWLKKVDTRKANLGSGKRQIVTGGVLDSKYGITVPKEYAYGPG